MLGIFEAEALGGFGDGRALKQERLRVLHNETADVRGGGFARQFADQVAEVVGGQEEFLSAVFDGGQAHRALGAIVVIMLQEVFEARQQIGVRGLGR